MSLNFDDLLDGKIPHEDARLALIELHDNKESVDDIVLAMTAMRKRMIPVETSVDAMDNCGTGGDGLHTFNISSIAALILASLDVFVAKHGNKSVTSKSGSADMLEALGIKLDLSPKQNAKLLEEAGFCFLFAQNHHPCMKFIMPIRKSIPHRTIFNIIGPLCNPARVKKHLIGVYDFEQATKMAEALMQTGSVSGITLCSQNGADEALPFENTNIASFTQTAMRTYILQKTSNASVQDLIGGDPQENARITHKILNGEIKGTALETVILNAALGLLAAQKYQNLEEAKEVSLDAVLSGKAALKLKRIVEISNKL